jgi:hypothetical protein
MMLFGYVVALLLKVRRRELCDGNHGDSINLQGGVSRGGRSLPPKFHCTKELRANYLDVSPKMKARHLFLMQLIGHSILQKICTQQLAELPGPTLVPLLSL